MAGAAAPHLPEARISGWDVRRATIALRIERTALQLFGRDGIERVTVERIASEAEISERTFFRYFQSREDVLVALPARALARISAAVAARPAEERLLAAFKAAVHDTEADAAEHELTLLWGQVMLQSPAAAAAAIGRLHPNMVEVFEQTIRARLEAIGRDVSTAGPLAAAIGGIVGYVYSRWVTSGGRGTLSSAFDAAFEALGELAPDSR